VPGFHPHPQDGSPVARVQLLLIEAARPVLSAVQDTIGLFVRILLLGTSHFQRKRQTLTESLRHYSDWIAKDGNGRTDMQNYLSRVVTPV